MGSGCDLPLPGAAEEQNWGKAKGDDVHQEEALGNVG